MGHIKSIQTDLEDYKGTEEEYDYLKARDELDNYIKATFIPTVQKGKIDDRHYQGEEYESVERENNKPSWDY